MLDHSKNLNEQRKELGLAEFDYVIGLTHTDQYQDQIVECIKPQGKFALIYDPTSFDILKFKRKCISVHWEFMFTRSLFTTADITAQHTLLNEISELIDAGTLKTTLGQNLGLINAANLYKAHQILESHTSRGKLVLEGF